MSKNKHNNQSHQPKNDPIAPEGKSDQTLSSQETSLNYEKLTADLDKPTTQDTSAGSGDGDGEQEQAEQSSDSVSEQPSTETALVDPSHMTPPAVEEKPVEAPVAQAAAVIEAPAPVVPAPVEVISQPPALTDEYQLPLSASPSSRLIITELKDYIIAMNAPYQPAAETGGGLQTNLYHTLIQAINTPAEDFEAVFTLVLKIIHDQADAAFSDVNVHRFTPHVRLSPAQSNQMRLLINTLTAMANPATRATAQRSINLEQALAARQIKEDARQRVMNFFNY